MVRVLGRMGFRDAFVVLVGFCILCVCGGGVWFQVALDSTTILFLMISASCRVTPFQCHQLNKTLGTVPEMLMLVFMGGGVMMLGMACSMLRFLWFVFWGGWGFVMSSLCWLGFVAYCVSVEVVFAFRWGYYMRGMFSV